MPEDVPMHFDQREQPLADTLAGTTQGFTPLLHFGRLSDTYQSQYPRLYVVSGGMATTHGIFKGGRFIDESTFFEIYRNRDQHAYIREQYMDEVKRDRIVLEPVDNAIFAAHIWDQNYQHFLMEVFPRLWVANWFDELRDLPFILTDHSHIREIVSLCFPHRKVIYVKPGEAVPVHGKVYYFSAIAINMGPPPEAATEALRFFRYSVLTAEAKQAVSSIAGEKVVYFGRRPDAKYQGNARVMVNAEDFNEVLDSNDIEIRSFDGKTLVEKAAACRDVSVAISPVGANLMNLMFLPTTARIVVVEHPVFKSTYFFPHIFKALGFNPTSYRSFDNCRLVDEAERRDNAAFTVNVDAFQQFLIDLK